MLFRNFLLAALPALAAAQDQVPLGEQFQAWFEKAKSFIPGPVAAPLNAGAARIASRHVTEFTPANWEQLLTPSAATTGPENWMILVTGGNKTCPVRCAGVDATFNKSATLLAADPRGPKLGRLDCEANGLLCSTWLAGPPSIWYIQVPGPVKVDQSKAATPIHVVPVNATTVTVGDMMAIHTDKKYADVPAVDSPFHPFDGLVAQYGLTNYMGYALFGFSQIPSWTFMLVISFVTRTFMSRRMSPPARPGAAPGAAPANPR